MAGTDGSHLDVEAMMNFPASLQAFLIMSRLSEYGISLSVTDLDRLSPRLINDWLVISTLLSPAEVRYNPFALHQKG